MRHQCLLLIIAICGGVGAVLRYSLSGWANQAFTTSFPIGTLLVNVIGCCLMGALSQAAELSPVISPTMKAAIGVGFLGGMTTFSTFGVETIDRINDGNWSIAVANVLANVTIGLVAVWLGAAMARGLLA